MAMDNGVIWEVNASIGSDTANGGGFSPACTGFATDLASTNATSASPVVTSASYNFISRDEGHYLFTQTGTNFRKGWWLIVSTSGGTATLDAASGHGVLYQSATANNPTDGISNPTVNISGGTWGIDYSRSATPAIAYTDMVVGATTTQFTSALNVVGKNIVGNIIKVTSGATVQRVQVLSTSTITATCSASLGTAAQVGVGGLGGALASPGITGGVVTSGSWVPMFGPNTYDMTSSSNVAGGRCAPSVGTISYFGYTAASNRFPYNAISTNRPILQSTGGNGFALITVGGSLTGAYSIDFENGNSNTTIIAFSDAASGWQSSNLWNCKFKGVDKAFDVRNRSQVEYCEIDGCTNTTTSISFHTDRTSMRNCVVKNNAAIGFGIGELARNVFYNNGSSSAGMIQSAIVVDNNLFHTTTGNDSGTILASSCLTLENNIFWNNTGTLLVAVVMSGNDPTNRIINCAFGSNTSDITTGATFSGWQIIGKITLSSDPITDVAGGDFSLNNVAGGGAELINAGFPLVLPGTTNDTGNSVGPSGPASSGGGATAYAF